MMVLCNKIKYGYYDIGKSIPHINTFTDGAHILVVRSPTDYISTTIRLEDDGWTVRDCIKVLLKDKTLQVGLLRKPFKGTVANNVLTNGCGGINLDICRIPTDDLKTHKQRVYVSGVGGFMTSAREDASSKRNGKLDIPHKAGRFPANLLLDLSSAELMDSQSGGASRFFFNFNSQEELKEYLTNLIKV